MSKLEKITDILLICASVTVMSSIAHQYFSPRPTSPARPDLTGKRLTIPGIDVAHAPGLALIAATRSDCKSCEESRPFYIELDRRRKESRKPAPLFFVSSESTEVTRRFVEAMHVVPDGIVTADFRSFGVSVTPTLILVDSDARVKQVLYGKLPDEDARKVFSLLDEARDRSAQ